MVNDSVVMFLQEWLTNPDKEDFKGRTFRIHITHNDLDGYGCIIVTDVIRHHLSQDKKLFHDVPIIERAVSNPGEVPEILLSTITSLTKIDGYIPGTDRLKVLVTDLAPDPSVFKRLILNGHLLDFCVIDHHEGHYAYDLEALKDDVLYKNGSYYIHKTTCATNLVFDICVLAVILGDGGVLSPWCKQLMDFAKAVNRFDLGNWGSWNCGNISDVPVEVQEQLIFNRARRDEKVMTWLANRVKAIDRGEPFVLQHQDLANEEWSDLVTSMNLFLSQMQNWTVQEAPLFSVQMDGMNRVFNGPVYQVRGLLVEKDEPSLQNYSLISRQILEDHPDIDMLVYIDRNRNTVELRSRKNECVDVSRVAYVNGGGGHRNAAGFPLPEFTAWNPPIAFGQFNEG